MHALPSLPRHPFVAGAVALLLVLILMAVAALEPGTIDFSFFGGGAESAGQLGQPLAESTRVTAPSPPAWVTDPLASPLDALAARP